MAGNTLGKLFRLTSFGESHGSVIGGVIDGFPPCILIDPDFIQQELDRRRPGRIEFQSSREESDEIEILSGMFEGKSTGMPIAFLIKNQGQKPGDYEKLRNIYRPSHADFAWEQKYGIRDHRGGGRASARETAVRVAGGAFAKILLSLVGCRIFAFTRQIGTIKTFCNYQDIKTGNIEESPVRCPDAKTSAKMTEYLKKIKEQKDSIGGIVCCVVKNCPQGLGEPVFEKLHSELAKAMMSINGARGFEIGAGFGSAQMTGSEHNDEFIIKNGKIRTETNNSGGVQGGVSNGEDIVMNIAFKPVPSIGKPQKTVDKAGNPVNLEITGRHDPCLVPRAVPVVEAMVALTLADFYLRNIIYQNFR